MRLESTNRIDATARFPELGGLPGAIAPHQAVIDGELVAFDDAKRPSFGRMQQRMHVADAPGSGPAGRRDPCLVPRLRPAAPRRERPHRAAVPRSPAAARPAPRRRPVLAGAGPLSERRPRAARRRREQGLEGLMAKRVDSRYEPGRRSPAWRKVKVRRRQEFVVGGWHPGERGREGQIGSLLVGYHTDEPGRPLRYAGKVGTGFTDPELARLGGADGRAGHRRVAVRPSAAAAGRPHRSLGAPRLGRRGRLRRVDAGRRSCGTRATSASGSTRTQPTSSANSATGYPRPGEGWRLPSSGQDRKMEGAERRSGVSRSAARRQPFPSGRR